MDSKIELSAHELELLKIALPYAEEIKGTEGRYPTQEELREKLKCRSVNAKHIQHYLVETDAVKTATRLQNLPANAEDKAVVQYALGDTSGSLVSHVLRENARLTRRVSKKGHEKEVDKQFREQEIREEIESLKELAKKGFPKPPKVQRLAVSKGNLLEINIADLHIGKLSWAQETGHESYDPKIADTMYRRAQSNILARAKNWPIEKVLLVVGNDLLNSDNAEGTTTKGTAVSNDGRYHKSFYRARNLMIESIEELRKVAPVHVLVMPGNHDRLACFHLGDSLEMFFSKHTDVTVDNEPTVRRYFQFGKVMLMFCHGDQGKRSDYPLLMASEKAQMWSETLYRECHTGHYHQTRTEETHGVRVRILPSLSPADAWHAANGYVGNQRSAEGYIWNREEGLIGQVFYNDSAYPEITTKREIA